MLVRTLPAFVALAAFGYGSLSAQQNVSAAVGDHVVVQMTGELAAEYGKRVGAIKKDQVPPGLEISTTATIAQKLDDGRIGIEHTSHIVRDREPIRLVTFTTTVNSTKLTMDVTPKDTAVYASPADHQSGSKPSLIAAETKKLRVTLSDLKGLKLRTWTLAEELGD